MKKELVKGLTMLVVVTVFALAAAVVSANAQSAKVRANIPFEFSIGYKPMPAGEYTVQQVSQGSSGLMIRSTDGKRAAIRLSDDTGRSKNNNTKARLVFHRYGERYFLAEVWNGFNTTGRHLLKSKEESAIEKELASIPSTGDSAKNTYETVEILAALR
jgi:hypothetical protein